MIKAIVTDMDGTLLNGDDQISERTKEILMQCQKNGICLVLASGRSYLRLEPYVQELKMREYNGFLIEINGMATQSLKKGSRTIVSCLSREEINELFDFIKKQGDEIQAYLDDGFFNYIPEEMIEIKQQERKQRNLPDDYPWSGGAWTWNNDMRGGYPKQKRINEACETDAPLNKIAALNCPQKIDELFSLLIKKYGKDYEIVRTCPRIIEITAKGVTKGNALRRLMEENGWSDDEVIVFGDGENDVSMFEQVKTSVAMANAEEYVKQKASFITQSNKEEGLAAFLEKNKILSQ